MLGILGGTGLEARAEIGRFALPAVVLGTAFQVFRRRPWKGGIPVFFFFLGMAMIHRALFLPLPPSHILSVADQGKQHVFGRVTTLFPKIQRDRLTLCLAVTAAGPTRAAIRPATGTIQVTIMAPAQTVSHGDLLAVRGIVRPFRNFANPGGFDYVRFMKQKKILARLYCRGWGVTVRPPAGPPDRAQRFIAGVAQLRSEFSRFIDRTLSRADTTALVTALVLGDTDLFSTGLRETFSRTGASHILAISGLHLSIVATVFFFLFKGVFSLCKPLLVRGLPRKWAAVATLFPLAGYAFLSGFSPATQRALVMVSVMMLALVMERENVSLNALAAAGLVILVLDPAAVFSLSFQLSFCAVLFIILGMDLARHHDVFCSGNVWLNRAGLFLLVSILAIAGTQPLVLRGFNTLSLVGVLTNGITIPAIGFGVLPLGLGALMLFLFAPGAGALFLVLSEWIATPCLEFLAWTASLSWTWTRTITPDLLTLVLWYVLMAALYAGLRGHPKKSVMVGAAAIALGLVNGAVDVKHRFFNSRLKITVLDVGQGNAALIHLPGGRCFLVDGGGFPRSSAFDTGRYLVGPFLWRENIMTLEGIILSHADSDHMNGLFFILDNFHVKRFFKNGDHRDSAAYRALMERVRSTETVLHEVNPAGETLAFPAGGQLTFLPGLRPFKGDGTDPPDANDNSLVLRVDWKAFSMLFTGDILARREGHLARDHGPLLASTLLLVPHHGSRSSSTPDFLDRVQPAAAVVSCGWRNWYGFPHPVVVGRYEARQIPLVRTDRHGAIRIVSPGSGAADLLFSMSGTRTAP